LILSAGPLAVLAQDETGGTIKSFRAVRTADAITIDGLLDEAAWESAAVVDDIHQIVPLEYSEPSQRTQFLVLYDDDAFYFAAKMYDDEPNRVTANVLREGGDAWRDDQFNIYLDPFNDKRSGYRFQVNPNSVFDEGLFRGPTQVQWEWDGIWQAVATQDDEGWVAETRIPFKTLTFNPESDTWGINFSRRVARDNETVGWVSRNQVQNPAISGEVTGLENLQQGVGLDVITSLTGNERRSYVDGSSASELEPSLDVFYKLTPTLNGSLTINTDFSATVVDARQVNLTRFGLFFPEQRQFFLQDTDIFEFGRLGLRQMNSPFSRPLQENARPFFSRSIGLSQSGQPVDLNVGGKVTGRVGRWNIGTLAIQQDDFEDIEATDLFVGRVSRNILAESSIGFIATDGDPQSDQDNSLVGMDFLYQNTRLPGGRMIESELWYQQSDTEGLEDNDSSWGARFWMPNSTGFRGGVGIKEIERNFNPALGFVNRRNVRDTTAEFAHTYRPTGLRLRALYSGATLHRIERLTGGLQSEVAKLLVNFENQTGDKLEFTYQNEKEGLIAPFEISDGIVIPPGDYSFDQLIVGIGTGQQRRTIANLSVGSGDFYDGTRDTINADLELKPSIHFRAFLGYNFNDISLPQGDFQLRLARLGLDFVFSSTFSWTNLIQYDNDSETVGINSRLHWRPQAGRDFFIVLNHSLEDLDRDNNFHSAVADFTAKFNYTFRF
jgi:hypothetical protein